MRDEPEVIGPKYAIRLGDLHSWYLIEPRCFSCGHVGAIYPDRLKKLRLVQLRRRNRWVSLSDKEVLGMLDHEHVADFETILRCTRCGNRENNSLRVVKLPRNT